MTPPSPGFPKLGTIHFGRAQLFHCIVWRISKTGGLVYLSRPKDVPDIFKLTVEDDGLLRPCVVSERGEISIQFREIQKR